jgi:hypothetical protein
LLISKYGCAYALLLTPKGREKVLKAVPIVEGIDAQFFNTQTTHLVKFIQNLQHLVDKK